MAKQGTACIELPKTHFDNLDFSFSGIKTAVINLNHKDPNIDKADLCASFQKTVTDLNEHIISDIVGVGLVSTHNKTNHTNNKLIESPVGVAAHSDPQNESIKLVLAGGVSANSYIRNEFSKLEKEENIKIYYPELKLCTDNAAMIASAGYYNYLEGNLSDFTLNAVPNLKL